MKLSYNMSCDQERCAKARNWPNHEGDIPGLYLYFFNHPGQIHQLSDIRVSHIYGFSHVLQLFK